MTKKYKQATLTKGNSRQVTWIEDKDGVKVGSEVQLLPEDEYWYVEDLSSISLDKKAVNELQENARKHRKATDI